MVQRRWFVAWGWVYRPVTWQAIVLVLLAALRQRHAVRAVPLRRVVPRAAELGGLEDQCLKTFGERARWDGVEAVGDARPRSRFGSAAGRPARP